ncbi:MAG: NAD(+) synthase [Bacteroidales bacterium]|nr:NAD(+) synthase [Bacteroidales bacterium]
MIKDYESAINNIQSELKEYLVKSKLKSLILGVSGGIDSALTAALARPVCDGLNIKLFCRSITISTNKPDEIKRAELIGKAFGHDFKEVNLSDTFDNIITGIVEDFETTDKTEHSYKIRQGNVKARMRMMYLYELAAKHRGMVLSTDNYTELLLGFWTLHGDVGDYGMIQNIWKTEVYAMSAYLVKVLKNKEQANSLDACIDAVPTDGLGITNSDLDQIGASSYQEVDEILIEYLKNTDNENILNHKVVQRKIASEFKRNNPFNIPRKKITDKPYFLNN